MEGFWRHVKHSRGGIPKDMRVEDRRLNGYIQSLVWRMQICGDPFWEVLRMARAFRQLPLGQKLVFKHGLRDVDADKGVRKSNRVNLESPMVKYTKWVLSGEDFDEEVGEHERWLDHR